MKSKLGSQPLCMFKIIIYVQDNYSQLNNLSQGNMSVDEYTRQFKKLLIKCDIQELEEQTVVRYLGGRDPRYSNVIEL